jgi:hypothetical protein
MQRYYAIQEHDSDKLRAVVRLLEEHATYRNLTLAQVSALKDVISFIKQLPGAFDASTVPDVKVDYANVSTHVLKDELAKRGYGVHKKLEE